MCQINSVNLKCGSRRRKFRRIAKKSNHNLVLAEFELEVKAQSPTGSYTTYICVIYIAHFNFNLYYYFLITTYTESCDVDCVSRRTRKTLKWAMKRLRRPINKKENKFLIRLEFQ